MDEYLKLEDVWYSYPNGRQALKGVTLSLKKGTISILLGPNGCGKTTLLLVAAGLLQPQRGQVKVMGKTLTPDKQNLRKHIGIVFQDPDDQLFNPTVYDEIAFAPRQLGYSEEKTKRKIEIVSKTLGIQHLLDRPTHTLSMGEKRKVALASVLVYDPDILLLDEPTANIETKTIAHLLQHLCQAKKQGKAILIATQRSELAQIVADNVHIMENGKITFQGTPTTLAKNPDILQKLEIQPLNQLVDNLTCADTQ
ncbi:MAG: ABC transporter ATP-binding protein [Thermoprotei archaeon]|nr:MAG: ABC transporter ATP-binding protein [Thermoprotei archaeon]